MKKTIKTYFQTLSATIFLAIAFSFFIGFLNQNTANAAWSPGQCGVVNNGNIHSYAGIVVELYVSVNGGTPQPLEGWRTAGMNVRVSTIGRTASPPGNVVRLDGSGGVAERLAARDFNTINDGSDPCDGMVVLRGTSGHWAIDCDISINGISQQIGVSSADPSFIPVGYNGSGYISQGWSVSSDVQRPKNGGSAVYKMIYSTTSRGPQSITAEANWRLSGQTSTANGETFVRRGQPVNFVHNISAVNSQPMGNPINAPTCNSNSQLCLQRKANYDNEKVLRNEGLPNYSGPFPRGFIIQKAWSLVDINGNIKDLLTTVQADSISIVNQGVGSDRGSPYNVSVSVQGTAYDTFNTPRVQNQLAAGDTYCESSYATMASYSVWYLSNGSRGDRQGGGSWFPSACVTIRSEWGVTTNGGNQNIERTDNNGVASRGVGEVVSPDTARNGDYTFSDVWVNEKYRINGWIVNGGPEFSDEPITVHTQVTDNITGGVFDPANSFTSGYNIPPGADMSPHLGYDILSGNQPIPADAAGKGVCQRTFWNSAFGDPNPNFNGNTPLACIYVPYFYHMKDPTLSRQGSGPIQQGDNIQLQASARLPQASDGSGPGADNNGRHHTNSENIGWAIERSDDGGPWSTVSGHSGSRVWQPNNNQEIVNDPNNPVVSSNDTRNMPVGKKLCFRLRIDKGSQDTGPIYSEPECHTITKSPKIQVGNRDVLTGYGIPTSADDSSCSPNSDASITTKPAPSYVSSYPDKNLYGSWGEYGVFATGQITGFGSAAYDSSDAGAGKLRFSNQDSNGGYKSYGNPCTFNWFEKVGKKATDPSGDTFQVNDPVNAGKQVSHEGKIDVTAPGAAATTVEDTSFKNIKVSVFARDISSGIFGDPDIRVECPKLKITLSNSSTVNTGQWCTNGKAIGNFGESKDFDFVLNSSSYNPGKVTVQFINDASGPNGDRNIAIDTVTIKRVKDNTTAVIKAKDADKSQRLSNGGQSCSNDSIVVSSDGFLIFHQDITQYGHCYGIDIKESDYLAPTTSSTPAGKVSNIASPPLIAIPPLTNSSSLPANKKATVIYAKSDDCSNPGDGVIYIKNNIEYDTNGYNIEQIPRVILLADCGIIIDKDVTNVDASLITRGTINTCSARQASNIPLDVTSANYALTKDDCNKPLKISGHILAKKVNLLRTYGADLTSVTGDPTIPAEDFTQNPIDFISTYRQSYQEVKLVPEDETNLPPRY